MKKHPNYYAFFDVDNTIVKIKTMRSFMKYFYNTHYELLGRFFYKKYELIRNLYHFLGASREFLNKRYYEQYKGFCEIDIKIVSDAWFYHVENTQKNLYIDIVLNEIEKHKNNGAEIVLVSGSFEECLLPIAKKLGIDCILATKLEYKDGVCTGKILPPQTIGNGKVLAIKQFLTEQKCQSFEPNNYYAYGDHISDLPMLSYVGKPHVIKGNANLEAYAIKQGWPILSNN